MTTFGPVSFPWFAYRELRQNGASVTRNPAQAELFPAFSACRSSRLCLEWACRLGSDHPFRVAQEALSSFTHEAVALEDITIARHLVRVGQLVSRDDRYRTPEEIREILRERATRDRQTDRPLLHCSSDAHALRRFVDDAWAAKWKMANGLRLARRRRWPRRADRAPDPHQLAERTSGEDVAASPGSGSAFASPERTRRESRSSGTVRAARGRRRKGPARLLSALRPSLDLSCE